MKNKVLLVMLMLFLLFGGWYTQIDKAAEKESRYQYYSDLGDEKYGFALYQEAAECYEQAIELKMTKDMINKLIATYENYYQEDASYNVRKLLIHALAEACENYPEESAYWEREIELYIEGNDYDSALAVCKRANDKNIESENIQALQLQIRYAYSISQNYKSDYKDSVNGYFLAATGEEWRWVTADDADKSKITYKQLGYIGENGIFPCETEDGQFYFTDMEGIKRGIVVGTPSGFGVYSEGYCAIELGSTYSMVDLYGKTLVGNLAACGCFQNGLAPVQDAEGRWGLINTNGEITSIQVDDIRYDFAGRYLFNETVIAAENGEYHFYNNTVTKQINEFSCKEVDIPTSDGLLAFEDESGKWGFVNCDGEVIIEPQYEAAKSFSNHLAAVGKDGKWGYINRNNVLVVDYQFYDCSYVSDQGVCYVSDREGYYTSLRFKYPELL